MKLYNADLSPFATRIRLQAALKGITLELLPMPQGEAERAAFRKINPMCKVPTLVDGDFVLPESESIALYLEQKFPEPSLLSQDPQVHARTMLLARISDIYVMQPLHKVFEQLNSKQKDRNVIGDNLVAMLDGLGYLEHFSDDGDYLLGDTPSLADCQVVPVLFMALTFAPKLGTPEPLKATPRLARYWAFIQEQPAFAKAMGEMQKALIALQKAQ